MICLAMNFLKSMIDGEKHNPLCFFLHIEDPSASASVLRPFLQTLSCNLRTYKVSLLYEFENDDEDHVYAQKRVGTLCIDVDDVTFVYVSEVCLLERTLLSRMYMYAQIT